ncbi:MAG: phenylalanine--tRNA ligase subunit beta [Solirubrobacterales bacterium]
MRVPLTWLREYCDPPLDVHGVEERLTMTGTKVEAIHHHGVRALENFLVGRVLESERHPDADRLSVCVVDLGPARPEGPASIVCGAANVAAGQSVAVARPGAVMPDGSKLKKAKLRGVPSEGMILAEDELAIGSDHDGIMVLEELVPDAQLAPGTPLEGVLPLATEVLELEVTPNRPDCLAVYGVARELHAATGASLALAPWAEDPGAAGPVEGADVEVQCPELCPRFTARVFHGVTIAPSPPWLKARLMAAGQRPINNVVDITNYAMLLAGQPLHAFDLDRVAGRRLVARRAREGEQVQTLDGQTRTLDGEMVVIDDAEGPTSIAGLMGGARSEVAAETTSVLLEVATWNGPAIHRASWALGLRSEASARFEKGLQPEQCMHAQALATRLMIELCGATVAPGTIDIGGEGPPPPTIRLRSARVEAVLGVSIARPRQAEILEALDFQAADAGDGLDVSVPALRRNDITREADLIEEVARIDGLEKLPATLPKRRGAYGMLSPAQRLRRRAVDALVGRGLYEVVGWTFTAPTLANRLRLPPEDLRRRAVVVENPLSEEHSQLRTTLLGSLLDVARHNLAHGASDLRLFEHGTVFRLPAEDEPAVERSESDAGDELLAGAVRDTGIAEHRSLAMLLTGRLTPNDWRTPEPAAADLFAVKALLEALAEALRVPDLSFAPEPQPFLHPGRSAAVALGGAPAGWLGELHPLVAEAWELPGATCLEIDFDLLIAHAARPDYVDLIGYPPLRQDLAVVLPADVPAAMVLATATAAGGKLLADARVFDVYSGPQVGEGRRSLALALAFRASDRTLSDEDIAPVRERIVAALAELGGELRG